ncbi:MAG: hypothetical protein DCC65_10220 [Planctomycetota bacterium]|nr:MAG: hypothetical protein DCC65_10220 [Planctomycetota bacterium]
MKPPNTLFKVDNLRNVGWIVAFMAVPAVAGPPADALAELRRLNPHLKTDDVRELPMKVRSLANSPHDYFRGAADIFYEWCATSCRDWIDDKSVFVTLHGDVHIGNLGTHLREAGSAPMIDFGVVDFDEVVTGPFQLDLLRGLTSLRFAAAERKKRIDPSDWAEIADRLCGAYEEALSGVAPAGRVASIDDVADLLADAAQGSWKKHLDKYADGQGRDMRFRRVRLKKGAISDIMESLSAAERTEVEHALWNARLACDDTPLSDTLALKTSVQLRAAILDAARWTRLGSAGSQGMHKYLILLHLGGAEGAPAATKRFGDSDVVLIELKEEPPPGAVRAGLLKAEASPEHRAREVAAAHCAMWGITPPLVGHARIGDHGFLLRLKDPWSEELDEKDFKKKKGLLRVAEIMGHAVGLAHRGGLKPDTDAGRQRVEAIRRAARSLPAQVLGRSRDAEKFVREQYAALRDNPDVKKMRAVAEAFIAGAAAEGGD